MGGRGIWVLALKVARRLLRLALWRVNRQRGDLRTEQAPSRKDRDDIREFLVGLDHPDQPSREYLAFHLERIVATLCAVPQAQGSKRALELGSFFHMAPALVRFREYRDLRCAYFGTIGTNDVRTVRAGGDVLLRVNVDLFDAERDRFPYPDHYFNLVLACEVIEHLQADPMHLLFEAHRVLQESGRLLITTPNCTSWTSIQCVLDGKHNPYVFAAFPSPDGGEPRGKHVREFTPFELQTALEAAGFVVDALWTTPAEPPPERSHVLDVLLNYGFPVRFRGEQLYCLATKRSSPANRVRYPSFLYQS